jgi:hypothetical protein
MSTDILWSSISFYDNKSEINKYENTRKSFNKKSDNKDNKKEIKKTSKGGGGSENKLLLEKINNYIKNLKENNLTFENINILTILKEQESICTYLCKYVLQNNYLNFEFFIGSLNILKFMSEFLRNNLKQKKFTHDLKKLKISNSIPRSSYKFCHFKDSCVYNYDNDKNGCYADHYVHNLVEADIEALIEYINNNYDKNIINHNKEIIKCINTLCFVLKHMSSELNSLCIYCEPNEYQNYHINKIVKKKGKKKKKTSKSNK